MKGISQAEKRREERYPQNFEVVVQELVDCDAEETRIPRTVCARIQNVSRKGLGLITPEPLRPSSVVRCEIPVCDTDVPVATLMQVRWTRRCASAEDGFISGLAALL